MSYKDKPLLERITPEPWVNDGGLVNGRDRKDPSKPSFDLFDAATMPGDMDEMFSNADIMAAGPALYRAIKGILSLRSVETLFEAAMEYPHGQEDVADELKALKAAQAAIAQAEGRP